MYDRQTESLWSQLGMVAVAGPYAGTSLRWLPSRQMSWKAWRDEYPLGRVLSADTGHARDYFTSPHADYEASGRPMFPVPVHRRELSRMAWVAGIVVAGRAKAYRLQTLPVGVSIDDEVAGVLIRIRYDRAARLFEAERSDTCVRIPSVLAYWFAWQAFSPETDLK